MAEGVLFFIQSPILSPFSADGDVAGLPCYILGLRHWNSDDVRTLQSAELTASSLLSVSAAALRFLSVSTLRAEKALHRDAMLHGASNRRYTHITARRTEYLCRP